MRISDWSSDVCSSDLPCSPPTRQGAQRPACGEAFGWKLAQGSPFLRWWPGSELWNRQLQWGEAARMPGTRAAKLKRPSVRNYPQIGKASCRERVVQYV